MVAQQPTAHAARRRLIDRVFRPEYGRLWIVRPKRWWSLRDRRCARLAAQLCDHQNQAILESVRAAFFFVDQLGE